MKNTRKKTYPEASCSARIRLVHIPAAVAADGEPCVALKVPQRAEAVSRRTALIVFGRVALAFSAKRVMEAGH